MELHTFCITDEVQYYEQILQDPFIFKYYELKNPDKKEIIAFPDGCIDVQCGMIDGECVVALTGSYVEGGIAKTSKFQECFGLKLRPGIIPGILQGKMHEMVGNQIFITELFNKKDLDTFFLVKKKREDRISFFKSNFFDDNIIIQQPEILGYIIDILMKEYGNVNISDIITHLGYSHRYTDRVFKNNVGFSIKKYAGIYRLQRAIQIMMKQSSNDLCDDLGYYDQSHFIHDFKRFTSFTPYAFTKIAKQRHIV